MDKKKCTAIVLSAGQGKRMGSAIQKQYIELSGKPIIFYTLDAFQKSAIIDDIVLVVGERQENWVRDEIVEKYQLTKVRSIIPGGKERYDSVWAGLRGLHALKEQPEYVFIHDGARMFVDEQILTRGYENVEKFGACVAGMPSKDTVKLVDEDQFAVNTPPRKLIWAVQTPQIFKADLIENAYAKLMEVWCIVFTLLILIYGTETFPTITSAERHILLSFKFSSIIIFFITKNKPDFLYDSFIQKVRLVF